MVEGRIRMKNYKLFFIASPSFISSNFEEIAATSDLCAMKTIQSYAV
jgi:hypothetical protein